MLQNSYRSGPEPSYKPILARGAFKLNRLLRVGAEPPMRPATTHW